MKVLIADGQYEVRSALRLLVENQPSMTVVTEAVDTPSLLAAAASTNPDLILADWDMPGIDAAVDSLEKRSIVVAMSSHPDRRKTAISAGADAFVCKGDNPAGLLDVLRSFLDKCSEGGND